MDYNSIFNLVVGSIFIGVERQGNLLKIKYWSIRISVLLGSVFIGLLVCEIILRLFFFQPVGRIGVVREFKPSAFPGIGYELLPDHTYEYRYGPSHPFGLPLIIPVRINHFGFRGGELRREKAPGTVRILAIGDSYTFGQGVLEPDIYHAVLKRELERTAPEGVKIEVINAGVPGYNFVQEVLWYRNYCVKFHPDIVLWGFNTNDGHAHPGYRVNALGVLTSTDQHREKANPLIIRKPRQMWTLQDFLITHSQIARQFQSRILRHEFRGKHPATLNPPRKFFPMEVMNTYFQALETIIRNTDTPFLAVVFSMLRAQSKKQWKTGDWFISRCKSAGLPCIDLQHVLDSRPIKEFRVHPTDYHPNAKAHRIYAEQIIKCLKWDGNKLTVRCCN